MQTDEELMLAYREGDRASFDVLVRRHWPTLEEFVRRLLGDPGLADDVLVECFFKLHRSAQTYQPQARFTTFLFRIAYHEAIDTLRKQRRRNEAPIVSYGGLTGPELRVAYAGLSSEARMVLREDMRELETLLKALPETPRAVFLLYYREELSTPEIAETLGIPVTSVRAYLSLTRKGLREAMAASADATTRAIGTRR